MTKHSSVFNLVIVFLIGLLQSTAWAQYPTRPIVLVSPYAAGGGSDGITRLVAEGLAKELKQPVIVENKPGADGAIGVMDVINSKPDGYRLLFAGGGALVTAPAMKEKPRFDAVKDLTPIAGVIDAFLYLYIWPEVPAKNLAEFIAYARKNPGEMKYAATSGSTRISSMYLFKATGVDLLHIPYRGEAAAIPDVVVGRVQALMASAGPAQLARTGKLRAIVNTLSMRSQALPDVPTLKESGFGDLPFPAAWVAAFGPAGLPKEILDTLNKAFTSVYKDPANAARMAELSVTYRHMDQQTFATYVRAERDNYQKLVQDLAIPKD